MIKNILLSTIAASILFSDDLSIKLIPAESAVESQTAKNLYNEANYYTTIFNGEESNTSSIPTMVAVPGNQSLKMIMYRIRNGDIDEYNVPQPVFSSEVQTFETDVGPHTEVVTFFNVINYNVTAEITGYIVPDGIYTVEYEEKNNDAVEVNGGKINFTVNIKNPPLRLLKDGSVIGIFNYDRYRFPEYRNRDLELIPVSQSITVSSTTDFDKAILNNGITITPRDSDLSVSNIPAGDYQLTAYDTVGEGLLTTGSILVSQASGTVTRSPNNTFRVEGDTLFTFEWNTLPDNDLVLKLILQPGI